MKRMCRKSWHLYRALTLIEVIAGIAILGVVLVSIAMATGRLRRQSYLSSRRVEAYRAADELLAGWWSDLEKLPRNGSGVVPSHDNWHWRTVTTETVIKNVDAEILTLEILQADSEEIKLANVQLVLFLEKDEEAKKDE